MLLAAALEKTLLCAFDCEYSIPDEISLYSKDVNIDKLKLQIQMLLDLLKSYNQANPSQTIISVTSLRTLCDLMNSIESSKTMLSEVFQLLRIILTMLITSATAERTFSTMRRLKNFLWSTMSQTVFNNLMLLHVHKDKTDQIDLHNIANQFIDVNSRRKNFFGNN